MAHLAAPRRWGFTGALRRIPCSHRSPIPTRRGRNEHFPAVSAIPPICFSEECQSLVDRTSLVVIGVPLAVAAAWIAYLVRPIPKKLMEQEEMFEDPSTGIIFQAAEGQKPERDAKGELAFRAIGFTPWPVTTEEQGERIRIDVGPVDNTEPRTFIFRKVLRFPSKLITLSLPRPLGIVFSEDAARKCVVVESVIPGSNAEQQCKVAELSSPAEMQAPLEGDVLRGVTCTNFVYPTDALLGMKLPQKHIVVFGADGQSWRKCRSAFKGSPDDGEVTVVLERQL